MPSKGTLIPDGISGTSYIGSSVIGQVTWDGGRTALTIAASQFGTSVQLQLQAPTGLGLWVPIASAFVASQYFVFDAAPGQYRLVGAGSSISLSAQLSSVSYFG